MLKCKLWNECWTADSLLSYELWLVNCGLNCKLRNAKYEHNQWLVDRKLGIIKYGLWALKKMSLGVLGPSQQGFRDVFIRFGGILRLSWDTCPGVLQRVWGCYQEFLRRYQEFWMDITNSSEISIIFCKVRRHLGFEMGFRQSSDLVWWDFGWTNQTQAKQKMLWG